MDVEDIRNFVDRDWKRVRASKSRYWARQKSSMTPEEALRFGDQLRRHVLALRPDWPDEDQRRADLASHVRVSKLLRRADSKNPVSETCRQSPK